MTGVLGKAYSNGVGAETAKTENSGEKAFFFIFPVYRKNEKVVIC